ncbi:hypothetical protein RYA05_02635 [Pseudomonas syringae pv. actinidiae]|nr:hypothetical protein [Pseudomonas syringae pv. actinidiae]
MAVIDRFESKEEFLSFRDHVGKVLKHKNFGISLKQRNLDELAAMLAGAADFNTALGMCKAKTPAAEAVHVPQPPSNHPYHEIAAELNTSVGGFCTTFDAIEFFDDALTHNSLVGILPMMFRRKPQHRDARRSIARFFIDSNEAVKGILDECFTRGLKYDCEVSLEHVHAWLLNKQQFLLASWLDMLTGAGDSEVETFAEYVRDFPEACYHSDSEGDVESFMDSIGKDFVIKESKSAPGAPDLVWTYQGIKSVSKFATKIDAIVDFLDQVPAMMEGRHPKGKIIDMRLTHHIVADDGYWGVGETLLEAKRKRPHYGHTPLSKRALVYRCAPGTTISSSGGLVWSNTDPAPVRINPRTGRPINE